jgi:hypothetical protein
VSGKPTALGQVRFDAERDYDHGDLFWAKCLAEAAAEQSTFQPAIIAPGVIDTGQDDLWDKVARGEPLTELEIDALR